MSQALHTICTLHFNSLYKNDQRKHLQVAFKLHKKLKVEAAISLKMLRISYSWLIHGQTKPNQTKNN